MLFTDIQGSTELLRRLGREVYVEALGVHRQLLREAFAQRGGVEVEMQGDSFFYAFPYARDAVAAAADSSRKRLLPMPGSPSTSRMPPRPASAARSMPSATSSSFSRPRILRSPM